MRRGMHLAVAVTIACLSAGRLAAQDNPLLGVWEHTDTQTTQMITFAPDGTWENRFAWAPSPTTGTGSGRGIARGEYQLTGPTSYSARAMTMEVCPYVPTPAEMRVVLDSARALTFLPAGRLRRW
jgi:hypothetical protein